jgi:hypothetical protein
MGGCKLGQAVFAVLLIALNAGPAWAVSAGALAAAGSAVKADSAQDHVRLVTHFRKTQSFYCYPKNYWWFYRPYTTAGQGYARCMPYFHYLDDSYFRSSGNPDRAMR